MKYIYIFLIKFNAWMLLNLSFYTMSEYKFFYMHTQLYVRVCMWLGLSCILMDITGSQWNPKIKIKYG